ncbi:hypothetical protein ACCO45_000224 [Purpureocillium lilacinum]|uniref:Uncharacterized protein n=1 Tax=Purpureocillium lilacinum TaxID=33203 RepID=A0ACC4E3L4_PURLI
MRIYQSLLGLSSTAGLEWPPPWPIVSLPRHKYCAGKLRRGAKGLEEEVGEQEAQQAENGHHLDGHARGLLLNRLRHPTGIRQLLLARDGLDGTLAKTAVLEARKLGLRLGQLGLELLVRRLGRLGNGGRCLRHGGLGAVGLFVFVLDIVGRVRRGACNGVESGASVLGDENVREASGVSQAAYPIDYGLLVGSGEDGLVSSLLLATEGCQPVDPNLALLDLALFRRLELGDEGQ